MRVRILLAALLASVALAGPAFAQTVGEGQVVTDPAAETEQVPPDTTDVPAADDGAPQPEPPPDASGRRGEIHVLDATASTSPAPSPPAPAQAPTPATSPAPVATAAQLPFTGVDAGALALIGLALLAGGTGLLVVLRPA